MTATFTLVLQDSMQSLQFEDVEVFMGEDNSGSFSLLAHHTRMMTSLAMGLARFRCLNQGWQYIAVPEAILYFHDNRLCLSTRRFLLDSEYQRVSDLLQQQLLAEESRLKQMKTSLLRMEEEVFRRLWDLGHDSLNGQILEGWQP